MLWKDWDFYLLLCAVDEMGNTFEQNNITIKISTSFRRYDDIAANLIEIKSHDARIIIGGYTEKAARKVLCQAYHLKMFGPRYVWTIIGDYVEKWWEISNDTNCNRQQLQHAAEVYFTIDSLNSLSDDDMSSLNIVYDRCYLMPPCICSYDTVWTIAFTLRNAIYKHSNSPSNDDKPLLEQFTYQNGTETRKLFFNIMQDLGFLWISGPISFEGPDQKRISVISQNQNGRMIRIALYEPEEKKMNFYCRTCQLSIWLGGRAPRDKTVLVSRKKKVDALAFLCASSVSVGGLVLASVFLAYNFYHRRLRYIKLSSPKLNNVAVIGCMLVYAGIIILGYDDTMLDEAYYPYLCTARAFLFAAGFSLSFRAIFTKTYRVHQILTRANRGLIKSKGDVDFWEKYNMNTSMTDVVKNIYTFANVLSVANTDCVKQWDQHSVCNALRWAKYCMKVEEETRNKIFRDDLDRQIQSMTILLKPVSLLHLSIDRLREASLILSKNLSQNPDTPAEVLAALSETAGSSTQNVREGHQKKLEQGERLYQFVGEDVSFMEQTDQSQAEFIMNRLVSLQRSCLFSQHRYDTFLEKVLTELQKYINGWTVIIYMFLTNVIKEEDYDVLTGIKTKMLRVVSSMTRDFDCGVWRCDCTMICSMAMCDTSFCDMYVDHLLAWAEGMVPVYGLFVNGDIYCWRYKDKQLNDRYSYTELRKHFLQIFKNFKKLKEKIKRRLIELSEQSIFNIYKDLLQDCKRLQLPYG